MKRCALGLLCLGAVSLLSGCVGVGDWDADAYKEEFHSSRPLQPGGRVTVETFNGSVEVAGWEQDSVEINGTKHAGSRSTLEDIKIDINGDPSSLRIRAVRPSDGLRSAGVHFSIRVPRKAVLELVSSSNGRIELESVDGNARLRTSNGRIRISRLGGNLEAETSNGTIEAHEVHGNVKLHTSNGTIRADARGGGFEATTSNGRIEVRLQDPSSEPVRLRSSNGHIELAIDAKELPEVRAFTNNSSILLRVPAMSNARVRAYTSHASVSSDFPELHSDRDRKPSEMDGSIGRGGPLLELETSNGPIQIEKL